MMFVHPALLWALFAISIPIIIHLFNFRRYKKVYFSNVRFLKELQQESKSKSRLKEILVLIARCLTILCLVLAFAQPVIKTATAETFNGSYAVSIYIDNSFSMENVQKQGPLLSIAKVRAEEIVKAFSGADRFQIITNDFEGKHQRFYSKEDVLPVIEEIKAGAAVKQISQVIKRQTEFLNTSTAAGKRIFLLTDAQRTTFDAEKIKTDSSVKITILPLLANKVNNVYIDTCWFENPLQQKGFIQKLHAVIVNAGSETINAGSAKLFINNNQQALASYSLTAGSKEEVKFTFECKESGFNFGSIKIEDYPVTFDDELFFSFNSQVYVSVTLINGKDFQGQNHFESLLKSDSIFKLSTVNEQSVDYSLFAKSELIILNELNAISSGLLSELNKFISKGGSLFFIPSQKGNTISYNSLLTNFNLPAFTTLDTNRLSPEKIESANTFYSGVFEKLDERINLPVINSHFPSTANNKSDYELILRLQNGDPLLSRINANGGIVYISSAPFHISAGNLSKHALFVPTIYRMAFNSLKSVPLFYKTNSNASIALKTTADGGDKPFRIKNVNGTIEIIPEMRMVNNNTTLFTHQQITIPGFYEVIRENEKLSPLAFNYSRTESDLHCLTVEELNKIIAEKSLKNVNVFEDKHDNISLSIHEDAQGKKLWKLFIILALSFILLEILLLRFLK
jgi:hypothetical protein